MTKFLDAADRVQTLIARIEAGEVGLMDVADEGELIILSHTLNADGDLHIVPAAGQFFAIMEKQPQVVLLVPLLTEAGVATLKERCPFRLHAGTERQLSETMAGGMWTDFWGKSDPGRRRSPRRAVGLAALALGGIAASPVVGASALGDPPVQVLSSLIATVAGCVLAAFAIFSGLALSGATGRSQLGANYLGDRVVLGWVVLSIFCAGLAYGSFAVAPSLWWPAKAAVDWVLVPALTGVGLAAVAMPLRDIIPFLLGRHIDHTAAAVARQIQDQVAGLHLVEGDDETD